MSEWEEVALSQISNQRKGINYKSEYYCQEDSGHPFITIKCFAKGGGYQSSGIKYFDGPFTPQDKLHPGDLLISVTDLTRAGDIVGSPLQVPNFGEGCSALASMDCMKIAPLDGECDASFLYFRMMLPDMRRQMVACSAGSTVLHLDTKKVPRMKIRIPKDVDEQKELAGIVRLLDQAIEKTEALIEKYGLIKTGMMRDLFTRGLTPDGKLRPPRDQAPELYKETPIGWIPKEWKLENLGKIIGTIQSGWSPLCDSDRAGINEWGILKTTAVVWDGYVPSENKKLPNGLAGRSSIETKVDDILITRKGPVDRVGVVVCVNDTPPQLMFPDTVFRTRVEDSNNISPEFLALALQSPGVQKYWWQRKIGLAEAQVNLNHGILRGTPFPKAPKAEQALILERFRLAMTKLFAVEAEKNKLLEIKTGLMHDLLTGKVAVKIDESAHV